MRPDLTEEEAIRQVLKEGGCADYVDVANAVQQRFGLPVGAAKVEKVVIALRSEPESEPAPEQHMKLGKTDIQMTAKRQSNDPGPAATSTSEQAPPAAAGDRRDEILRFVESMGGFDAARSAIDAVEESLKHLMQDES